MTHPPPEPRFLRQALGRFATGVTIITCRDADGQPVGLTANSFNALSLEPALVLWSLRTQSPCLSAFLTAPAFAVNVLGESQVDLSRRFASSEVDRFSEGQWSDGMAGVPVLAGCAAVFECERFDQRETGDHWLFIGRVCHVFEAPISPLVFQSGRYHLLGEIL